MAIPALGACHLQRSTPPVPPGKQTSMQGDDARSAYIADSGGDTLRIAWERDIADGFTVPVRVHGPVLIATTTGRAVITLDASTGSRYWSRSFKGAIAGTVLRRDDRIFLATGDRGNQVQALDIRSGHTVWSKRTGAVRVELLLLDDRIVAATETGEVVALRTADGQELWRTGLHDPAAVPPVFASGSVFIATTRDTLYRLDPTNGRIGSRLALGSTPSAPMLVDDHRIVAPLHDGAIVGIEADAPAMAWRVEGGVSVVASPVRIDDDVFVLDHDARIRQIARDGTSAIVVELHGAATASLTAIGKRLFAGRLDGCVFLVETDGTIAWTMDLGDSVVAPVAAHDGAVWVPLLHGRLVKLR